MNKNEFKDFLTSHTFYYTRPQYAMKYGVFTFEENGEIKGVGGQFENFWRIEENQLQLFADNSFEQHSVTFNIPENSEDWENGMMAHSASNGAWMALVMTDIERPEQLTVSDNLGEMRTFYEKGEARQALEKLASEDKTIDGESKNGYIVVPRKALDLGMDVYDEIHYTLEPPKESYPWLSNKLLIRFPDLAKIDTTIAKLRMYGDASSQFLGLSSAVAKNTYILRIADINLIGGSYYFNTDNFPNYEQKLQNLIKKISADLGVMHENIVLYGGSRGGTGALYHGLLGGYKSLAIDPIVNRLYSPKMHDAQLMFDFIPDSFTDKFDAVIAQSQQQKENVKIICSSNVPATFQYIKNWKVSKDKVEFLNINLNLSKEHDDTYNHGMLIRKTVPLQLSIINQFLYDMDIEKF